MVVKPLGPCAPKRRMSTTFRTIIKGKQFELILRFGAHGPNGFTTIDTFHAHEGKTLTGTIYGRLSEVR